MKKINIELKNFQKKLTSIKTMNIVVVLMILIFSVRESFAQAKNIPFSKEEVLELCYCLRNPVKASQNSAYYKFEWILFNLAGINDPENQDENVIKEKISSFVNRYHIELECPDATRLFPKGGFYRQLVANDTRYAVQALLEDYNINPNLIDSDGCTVLDYIDMIIKRNQGYDGVTTKTFKFYKELLIRHNAKNANELGGCCGCND